MNVLIVGLGSIAKKHIAALRKIDSEIVVYALRLSNPSALEIGVQNVYSIDDLASVQIDFIVISNPTAAHQESIELLLKLRVPLFIEKPVSNTLDFQCTIDKVKQMGILTYVACNLRFLECIIFLNDEIHKGSKRVNEVNVYCGSYLPDWRPDVDFRKVYSANADQGGGVHIDLIHEIDYLYWLFGMPEDVKSVFRNSSSLQINAYDYANYNLIYSNFTASVILNYYRREPKRSIEIIFEDETWEVDLRNNSVYVNGSELFKSDHSILDTYLSQMQYFIGLVQCNSKRSFNDIEDAYNVLNICLTNDAKR